MDALAALLTAPPAPESSAPRVFPRGSTVAQAAPVYVAVPLPPARPVYALEEPTAPAPLDSVDLELLKAQWAAEQEEEILARIAEAREEAAAEAREAIFAETASLHAADLATLRQEMAADLDRLSHAWDHFCERVEQRLVPLTLEIAEAALAAPLPESTRQALLDGIGHAVEALGAGVDRVAVRLHPVDLLRLQERGMADGLLSAAPALRWVTDPALSEGEWAVESPEGVVRHVRSEWFAALREAMGLESYDYAEEEDDDALDGPILDEHAAALADAALKIDDPEDWITPSLPSTAN